ncbi:vWA-MoxR associated conflict system protein [Paractinoplanes durhamensis]|uniref:vWA-MoxR associated conflict system protein n=1 Tax=Paractinoplanes durhamensis TaxID=113563 RepID=UPI00363AC0B1
MGKAAAGAAEVFRNAFKDLYAQAGRPKQIGLIALVRQKRPDLTLKAQTLNGWVTGHSLPSQWVITEILITHLQSVAEAIGSCRPEGQPNWKAMYDGAQEELRLTRQLRPDARKRGASVLVLDNETHPAAALLDDGRQPALGPLGRSHLNEMLSAAGFGEAVDRWTIPRLQTLSVRSLSADPALIELLRSSVDDFIITLKTASFVQELIPQAVTTKLMREALRLPGVLPDEAVLALRTLNDHLEWIALHTPGSTLGLRRRLARFVLKLYVGVDPGMDLDYKPLRCWARDIDALAEVNDAIEDVRDQADGRAVLIVSLHGSVAGDWPESVLAWFVFDGSADTPACCGASRPVRPWKRRSTIIWTGPTCWPMVPVSAFPGSR